MSDAELIKVQDLRRVDVRPGDRFVFKTDMPITIEMHQRLMEVWRKFMGEDVPLLILPPEFELLVFRQPDAVPERI